MSVVVSQILETWITITSDDMTKEVEECVCWHDVLKLVKQILCYKWVQKGLMVTKLEQVNYQPIEHHLWTFHQTLSTHSVKLPKKKFYQIQENYFNLYLWESHPQSQKRNNIIVSRSKHEVLNSFNLSLRKFNNQNLVMEKLELATQAGLIGRAFGR